MASFSMTSLFSAVSYCTLFGLLRKPLRGKTLNLLDPIEEKFIFMADYVIVCASMYALPECFLVFY